MTLKKWLRLYGITLLLGIAIIFLTGIIRYLFDPNFVLQFQVDHFGYFLIFLVLFGSIYGTFSHIMFFCFLVINLLGRDIIKYRLHWQGMQLIIIVSLIVINLAYLKQMYLPAFILLVSAFIVAYYKSKMTNYSAFIPTFFFMNIGTLLALIPVWDNETEMLFILPAVLVCNAWQIVQLHQVIQRTLDNKSSA